MNIIPCWVVIVTGRNQVGRRHCWTSVAMTYTAARREVERYLAMGHKARLEEIEELAALNLHVRRGELGREEAAEVAEPIIDKLAGVGGRRSAR